MPELSEDSEEVQAVLENRDRAKRRRVKPAIKSGRRPSTSAGLGI